MKAKDKEMPDSTEIDNWVAQMKVDGYRLILHISDGTATAFTRNMEDVTHSLPELSEIDWPMGDYIFDCEAIAYEDGEPKGYRATSERIGRKHNINTFTTNVHFEAFDCLYANGDISTEPFETRFSVLESEFPEHNFTSILELLPDISAARMQAAEDNYEGVIVKDLSAPYKFDKRSSFWRKLKLTNETIDLVVVDFEVGKGDDAGTLGRMRLETSDGENMGWVGNGWTDEEQDDIWNNKSEYRGSIAEISFEGIDKKPRFPVFEHWRPHGEADSLERVKNIGENY
jgi:DNA ligase-1